uniref:Uncharacterized protein n=1 Tax=Ditylenchus dipsaci TaxID=166011 RepID=A0A915DKE2_9BILA
MWSKSEVSSSHLLLHWMVFLALLFSSIGGIIAAPIRQSASELMAETEKWLSVGPGKTRDNAVFVIGDKNKLSFTLFSPNCLEDDGKTIDASMSFENGCELKMWWQRKFGMDIFMIDGVGGRTDHGSKVQVNLDGKDANYSFGGNSNSVPCQLNLDKNSDGDGYLANVSLTGTPGCEFKALFKYKQLDGSKRPSPSDVYSSASNSLSTLAIVGIVLGVVGLLALLGLVGFLLYCYLWKKKLNEEEKEVSRSTVPKQKKTVGKTCPPGPRKPTKTTQPVPSKYTEKGNLRALPPNSETLKKIAADRKDHEEHPSGN